MKEKEKKTEDNSLNDILEEVTKKVKISNIFSGAAASTVSFIPSGNIAIDYILGGGIPEGRTIEVYGQESSGKTTLTMCWIAQMQRNGEICALIDAERALEPKYVTRLGVDLSKLIVQEPANGEEAFEVVRALAKTGKIRLIVVDSVAALAPKAMLEGEMADRHVAVQARMMSQALSILTTELKNTKTTVAFLNQMRDNIGVSYGDTTTTPGGKALKFYSSVRLQMKRKSRLEDEQKRVIGNQTEVLCKKNKVGAPYRQALVEIYYSTGINKYSGLFDVAERLQIIKLLKGRTYEFQGIEFTKNSFETEIAKNPEFIRKVFEE